MGEDTALGFAWKAQRFAPSLHVALTLMSACGGGDVLASPVRAAAADGFLAC